MGACGASLFHPKNIVPSLGRPSAVTASSSHLKSKGWAPYGSASAFPARPLQREIIDPTPRECWLG